MFDQHNQDMALELLSLYYSRCKLVHRAAWYQFLAMKDGREKEKKQALKMFEKLKTFAENDFSVIDAMRNAI